MGSSYGKQFRITTFGESHGAAVGVVIDGCPAGLPIDLALIQAELDRRRPGQSKLTTQRKEADRVEVLSGIYEGFTIGSPIALMIRNADAKSTDYDHLKTVLRPSHADWTYHLKYGRRDHRGGGRSSARETAARVAAGAVAKQFLGAVSETSILAWVQSVAAIQTPTSEAPFTLEQVESSPTRCPHPETAERMAALIDEVRKAGDSVGGVVACRIAQPPAGLGEPVFDKLHAELGKAMLSINAAKGFEIGSGFAGTHLRGSEHNDLLFTDDEGQIRSQTNRAGGVLGGISNGEPIEFRVAFKPVATILRPQPTVDIHGNATEAAGRGRHDPCVLPRAVPIVEAMAALVLADFYLRRINKNRS